MFGQHDEMASAVSRQSLPEGVEVHSMASKQEEGEEEEREDDPIVDEEEKKKGNDDVRTTVTDAEIMEMHEKANEMELQDVENEDVDDETNFKNDLTSIKWMWRA